jgi:hypothetical protein
MQLREYQGSISFNGQHYTRVVISNHFEDKHAGHISDELILALCACIDGSFAEASPTSKPSNFAYYKLEPVIYKGKNYRLILTIDLTKHNYLGVVNAFRVK